MLLIPIGLIFVFFYVNVSISGFTVDLLLDAVGYILIAINAAKWRERSYPFSQALTLCIILAGYSLTARLLQPVGLMGLLVSFAELLMQMYLLYLLVGGIKDLEREVGTHLNSALLDRWRRWLSISMAVNYVCALAQLFVPETRYLGYLAVAVWTVLSILFIVVFFRTQHRYRLLMEHSEEA